MKLNRTNGKATVRNWVLIALLMGHPVVLAESSSVIEVGRFSAEKAGNSLPVRWELFDFKKIKRHTGLFIYRSHRFDFATGIAEPALVL